MSAIEQCRSAALGGYVLHCAGCDRWITCRSGFFLLVRVCSRACSGAVSSKHSKRRTEYAGLADSATFTRWLAPLRACE
ncbi:Putative transposase (plasmid) [Paraburkholderia phenoliruptrix BR3459a]|uniref:Putative transposase n=2 Tax=Paraburkholderia TaxID=1822464 RepID=K0DZB3_9BURK|nr:Putative transposase [Paraburkholderia phenoliruptrix BR3459a]